MFNVNRLAILCAALSLLGCVRDDRTQLTPSACEESLAEIQFVPESDFSASARCDVFRKIRRLAARQGVQRLDTVFANVSTLTLDADTANSGIIVLMLRFGDLAGPGTTDSSITYVIRDSVAFRAAIYPIDEVILRSNDPGRIGMDSLSLPLCADSQMDGSRERIDVLISLRDGGVQILRQGEACVPQRYLR